MFTAMEDDFRALLIFLTEAGARMEGHYFKLPVAGSEEPIFRERIYCYELYHQIRCLFEKNGFPYVLDGEVDKAAHPIIKGAKKPDFIVHKPGTMKHNLAVIEVKSVNAEKRDLKKDISTLDDFISDKAGYYRGIMLIYGNGTQDKPPESTFIAQKLIRRFNEKIMLLWHQGPGRRPEIVDGPG
jgi:hypothetical protein